MFLAFANGANDNFKGVATLYGSRTLSRRAALTWATLTTLAGSLTAAWLATTLMKLFSGKGLVPDALVANPQFTMAVTTGAAVTVWVAARIGIPVSTTHALVGALTGAGLAATGGHIHWQVLGGSFVWPLVASPFIALVLAGVAWRLASRVRQALGIGRESCLCLSDGRVVAVGQGP
ncbi:MAG: inorganic phosphate transporter, partial [Mariprofundaceae bacterium]